MQSFTIEHSESIGVVDNWRADSLVHSVVLWLALIAVQRVVGFFRAILFCRWLDAEQLGLWDMAFGFLMFAGPLAVLALPGAFGRYAEYYRLRGQLRPFLVRTSTACILLTLAAVITSCAESQRILRIHLRFRRANRTCFIGGRRD